MVVYTICCVCTIKRCLYFPVLFTFVVLFTSLNFIFVSCLFTFLRFEYILFTFVVLFTSLNFVFVSCLFAFLRFQYILFTFVVFFVCYLLAFWNSVYVLFLFVVLFTCFWANDVFYVLQNEKKTDRANYIVRLFCSTSRCTLANMLRKLLLRHAMRSCVARSLSRNLFSQTRGLRPLFICKSNNVY